MKKDLAVVVGYIMFYDLIEVNGSFFSKIDKAVEIGEKFCSTYAEEERQGWVNIDFEETLENFLKQ